MDKFPVMKAGDIVSAAHLNALSEIAKRYQAEVPDRGYGAGTPLRIMYITQVILEPSDGADGEDDSSYSSSSSDSRSSVSHSASSSSKSSSSGVRTVWNDVRSYLALPLYYDQGGKAWYKDTTHIPYELDASAFHGQFKVGDTCLAYWDAARNAYIAQPQVGGGGSSSSSSSDGGTDTTITGTCCCNELGCLRIEGFTGTINPTVYSFSPGSFLCGCSNLERETVSMTQVSEDDVTIWESEEMTCNIPSGMSYTKTKSQVWVWDATQQDWYTLGAATGNGSCSPAKPTYSGTAQNQQATTTCSETGTSTGEDTDVGQLFWRLTIVEDLVGGCDMSHVDLMVV